MASFGENLRREREMRGITLEEISAATKISVRFLSSIENEDFSSLPGGIFNRGFVRSYARFLGLDEDPILEEYQLAAKTRTEVDLSQFSPPRTTHSYQERRSRRTLWAVLIAIALLAIGISLWHYTHRTVEVPSMATNARPAKSSSANTSQGVTSTKPPANPTSPNVQQVKAASPGGVLAATSTESTAPPKLPPVTDTNGKLVLQIATTERSWVAIDADGKSVMQGVMGPNMVKTFEADANFDVLTGNAQGVILTLNGQAMKPLGREGEVKQIHLTWKDLQKQNSE
jgi:cytoskeleton protein RodZ